MIHYRAGSSDERVLRQVINQHCYRKTSIGFDVEAGEQWLDLGANIGAFALYCRERGAVAECYEPDPDCFELLQKNVPEFRCYPYAVSASFEESLPFFTSTAVRWGAQHTNHQRGCLQHTSGKFQKAGFLIRNRHGSFLKELVVDGCKMDIEGSEGSLIDAKFLPQCQKLVVEYHLSHDGSLENFRRRVNILQQQFDKVWLPADARRMLDSVKNDVRTYLEELRGYVWIIDPIIFCRR